MRGICPNCEKETELTFVEGCKEINVRGEAIPMKAGYCGYRACGEELE